MRKERKLHGKLGQAAPRTAISSLLLFLFRVTINLGPRNQFLHRSHPTALPILSD